MANLLVISTKHNYLAKTENTFLIERICIKFDFFLFCFRWHCGQTISVQSKIPITKIFDNPRNKQSIGLEGLYFRNITNVLHILLLYLINGYTLAQNTPKNWQVKRGIYNSNEWILENTQLLLDALAVRIILVCSKFYHYRKHKPWMGLRRTGSEQTC